MAQNGQVEFLKKKLKEIVAKRKELDNILAMSKRKEAIDEIQEEIMALEESIKNPKSLTEI